MLTLTNQDIDDIPFATGTFYWCDLQRTDTGIIVSPPPDFDDDFVGVTLTNDDIRAAWHRIINNADMNGKQYKIANYIHGYFYDAVNDAEDGQLDIGHIDTDAADVLIQIAIWDDIVYS